MIGENAFPQSVAGIEEKAATQRIPTSWNTRNGSGVVQILG